MNNKFIYKCKICGYLYDESKERVSFNDLDHNWLCPVCLADKSEFIKLEVASPIMAVKTNHEKNHIVIIGSGYAGSNLAMELYSKSSDNRITMITRDEKWLYSRPLLTRAFYSPELQKNMYIMRLTDMISDRVSVLTSLNVTSCDIKQKTIKVTNGDRGEEITYDQLVFATGSDAFIPPNLKSFEDHFHVLNNLFDYEKLLKVKGNKKIRIAIIGGGLIGCELASEFNKMDDEVELFHVSDRLIENVLNQEKSTELTTFFENRGMHIHLKYSVRNIGRTKQGYQIDSIDKVFDIVLVAAGFIPRVELARDGGIVCKRGIVVNEYLQTNIPDVFAIGDVAEINGRTFAYLPPINDQVRWLSDHLSNKNVGCFNIKEYPVKIKIHDLEI